MDRETFTATLNSLQKRVPFKPFTISLVNGELFKVDFPAAYIHRNGTGVYLSPGGAPVIFDYDGVARITADLLHREEAA